MIDKSTLPSFRVNDTISFSYRGFFGTKVIHLILDRTYPYEGLKGKLQLVGFDRHDQTILEPQFFELDRISDLHLTR